MSKNTKRQIFSCFVFFLLLFFAGPLWAEKNPRPNYRSGAEMRVLESGDYGYDSYVKILEEVRHDPDGVRCVVSACEFLRPFPPNTWRNGHYYEACKHEHRRRVKEPDYKPLDNPPGVSDLLCKNNIRESVKLLHQELESRVFGVSQGVEPAPKAQISQADADTALRDLHDISNRRDNEVARAPTPRAKATKPATPATRINTKERGFVRHPPLEELARVNPKAAEPTIARFAERRKSIRCIPRNTELAQLDEDGDLFLFVRRGADVADLKRCLPRHGFDVRMTAHNNNASSIIPYYLKDANKPARGSNLVFHEGRWNIKKPQWNEPGRTFYAEWLERHKEKKFGFALQAGQKIFLRMADTWEFETEEGQDTATEANTAKPKHGYNTKKEEIDESGQYRLAENCPAKQQISHYSAHDRKSYANASNSSEAVPCGAEISDDADFAAQGEKAIVAVSEINIPQKIEIQSAGRAYIRAGPRVDRVMYILQERYRQKNGGADLNLKENIVRHQAQERLPFREHYGQYAFG